MPECPICMEQIKDATATACMHTFCKECLDSWINEKRASKVSITCPCCRFVLEKTPEEMPFESMEMPVYEQSESDSEEEYTDDTDEDAKTDWDPDTESCDEDYDDDEMELYS